MYVLGIESTCDETAAAIVEDGRKVISNVISTSVKEQALYGGVDGLDFYRAICENWGDTLAHGGILLFECGWKQADAVAEILQKYGFSDVCIEKDDAGVPRIVIGRSPREDDDLTK